MNPFSKLHHFEPDSIIETANQYRNAKKKIKILNRKNNDHGKIRKLTILINEYENKNKKKIYKKKKRIVEMKINEDDFLNKEIEKMKIVKSILLKEKNKLLSDLSSLNNWFIFQKK